MLNLIQRIPRGLLAFLDARGTGINPRELGAVVAPTINLEHFYLSDQLEALQTQALGAAAVGSYCPTTIPAGEVWRVVSIGVTLAAFTTAATNLHGAIEVVAPGAAFGVALGTLDAIQVNGANQECYGAAPIPQPLVLNSGTIIQYRNGTNTGATTFTINLRILFQRLLA